MPSAIPTRESDLVAWSTNLATRLVATPVDFGITVDQSEAYATVQSAFVTAYDTANDPSTRTSANIAIKDTAKDTLVKASRKLVQILQNVSEMTNGKRELLQIPIRDTTPTPIPVPSEIPKLSITTATPSLVELELRNQENKKAKPEGVSESWLYVYVGATPPGDLMQWQFMGTSKRSDPQFIVPGLNATEQLWVTALWANPTGKPGPACAPVMTRVNYSGLSEAA